MPLGSRGRLTHPVGEGEGAGAGFGEYVGAGFGAGATYPHSFD